MKKWVRFREATKTENKILSAVNSLNLDDSSTKKMKAFISGGNLTLKHNRTRANKIINDIQGGTFNLEKYLKRDKEYQANKNELRGRNVKISFEDQVKLLHRTMFYYDNEDLIEEYNEERYNQEVREELEKRWEKYQDDEWGLGFDRIFEAMKRKK